MDSDEFACVICLCGFDVQETDKEELPHRLRCSHCFHKSCFTDWFRKQQICPICKESCTLNDLRYDPIITQLLVTLSKLTINPNNNNNNNNNKNKNTKIKNTPSPTTTTTTPPLHSVPTPPPAATTPPQVMSTNPNVSVSVTSTYPSTSSSTYSYVYKNNQPVSTSTTTTSTAAPASPNNMVSKLNNSAALYGQSSQAPPPPGFVAATPTNSSVTKPCHAHMLEKVNPNSIYRGLHWQCNYCSKRFGSTEQYHCKTCSNFDLCYFCCIESSSNTLPKIVPKDLVHLPRIHPHPLITSLPEDIYGNEAICDVCRSHIKATTYHCPQCGNFDVCSKCYNKESVVKTVSTVSYISNSPSSPAPSSPQSPSVAKQALEQRKASLESQKKFLEEKRNSFFSKYFNSSKLNEHIASALPETINMKQHPKPLIRCSSPLEVYDAANWICDLCKSHHTNAIETFFHSDDNYDVCLNCFHKYGPK